MTQEEKAKAYDEALEKAKKLYEKGTITESIGYIFPELAESEDEKIRKELIEHIKANKWADYVLFQKFSPDDVIAWLEKQGEKPQGKSALEAIKEEKADNANKVEPKFKVKYAGMAEGLSDDEKYQQGWHDAIKKQGEQNSAWSNGYSNGYIQAIEKAVEWLYQRQAVDLEVSDIEKFVNEFKRAMKGGEQ